MFFDIGYVHNDNLPLGNIALQYVIPLQEGLMVFSDDICTLWRSRKKLSNSPKLSCGFKQMCEMTVNLWMFKIITCVPKWS